MKNDKLNDWEKSWPRIKVCCVLSRSGASLPVPPWWNINLAVDGCTAPATPVRPTRNQASSGMFFRATPSKIEHQVPRRTHSGTQGIAHVSLVNILSFSAWHILKLYQSVILFRNTLLNRLKIERLIPRGTLLTFFTSDQRLSILLGPSDPRIVLIERSIPRGTFWPSPRAILRAWDCNLPISHTSGPYWPLGRSNHVTSPGQR